MRTVQEALASLLKHYQRATLSALGITVASIAIIVLVSIATGVRADVTSQIEEIGVNVLIVIPGRITEGTFNPNMVGTSFLRESDAVDLSRVEGVRKTSLFSFVGGGFTYRGRTASSILVATTPSWFQIHPTSLLEGRVLSDELRDEAVIGSMAKDALFPKETAVGKKIDVNGHLFNVIGVTKDIQSEGSLFSMASFQNLVYLPYRRVLRLQPQLQINRIIVQSSPSVEPKTLITRLDSVLGRRLDRMQYQVLTQEDLMGLVYKLMGILTALLTGLTSIALFVGGVGIMTVMLMSVNERSREIGIRKALGATSADIFWQFLTEAVSLAVLGGTVGLAVSYGACLAMYRFTAIKPMVTLAIVGLSFAVCTVIGAVFGLIPAMSAARKDPIEALRRE